MKLCDKTSSSLSADLLLTYMLDSFSQIKNLRTFWFFADKKSPETKKKKDRKPIAKLLNAILRLCGDISTW